MVEVTLSHLSPGYNPFFTILFINLLKHQERRRVPTDSLEARWFRMWVTLPKKRVI